MSKSLKDATAAEDAAIKAYTELMAAKGQEVAVLTSAVEAKTTQIGELGISIVQMKNDLTETEAALAEDKQFLVDMSKSCATKTDEWKAAEKVRADELAAISETIKILNDDESLELFKKTLPGASSSFMQVEASAGKVRTRAMATIRGVRFSNRINRAHLDLITLAL